MAPPPARPALRGAGGSGCLLAMLGLLGAALAVGFVLVFLDSGADRGRIRVRDHRFYPVGSVTHVPEHGFFLVNLAGDLLALVDLDAANQAVAGRRCRARLLPSGDPGTAQVVARYAARFSPEARGTTIVMREDCNSAVYDMAGVRVDADGPNLDRLGVSIEGGGEVIVDTQDRTCSRREGPDLRVPRECGG